MTKEFVTMPRTVVEQALEALREAQVLMERFQDEKLRRSAMEALRAALKQPQANQPAMTPIAQRKLDSLLAEGYTISGYSIYHERKHQHGFVTGAGLVGWWRPEGVEYPQPRGEQEPAGEAAFMPGTTGFTMACFLASDVPVGTKLYAHPQPKREPLTGEEIDKINRSTTWPVKSLASLGDRQWAELLRCAARAIEAAHNIK